MSAEKRLIVILGPTAIGKTALAIQLAQHLGTEIISADSRQFFKELNIGVARPSQGELLAVKHHFIAFLSVEDEYSAGMFEADALKVIDNLFKEHDTVVCCGGSMLYIDALVNGLDDLPGDSAIRKSLQDDFSNFGIAHLQEELKRLDPLYYAQADIQNPHRLMRALEVCRATGRRYSDLRKEQNAQRSFITIKMGLIADRPWLYNRINLRVDKMIEEGLVEETRSVYGLKHLNALNTVGYKELFMYLDGKAALNDSIEKIKQHTRNFAKRQLTWWRRDAAIHWIEVDKSTDIFSEAVGLLKGI